MDEVSTEAEQFQKDSTAEFPSGEDGQPVDGLNDGLQAENEADSSSKQVCRTLSGIFAHH